MDAEATKINNNAIKVKKVLSNLPIMSVGLVNILSIGIKFFSKTTPEPITKEIDKNE